MNQDVVTDRIHSLLEQCGAVWPDQSSMKLILLVIFSATVTSLAGTLTRCRLYVLRWQTLVSEDYQDQDYDYEDDYESGDYEEDYYDESGVNEDYEEYSSGESSGDFYEYETKYYYIPYCRKHEEQQRPLNRAFILFIFCLNLSLSHESIKIH